MHEDAGFAGSEPETVTRSCQSDVALVCTEGHLIRNVTYLLQECSCRMACLLAVGAGNDRPVGYACTAESGTIHTYSSVQEHS